MKINLEFSDSFVQNYYDALKEEIPQSYIIYTFIDLFNESVEPHMILSKYELEFMIKLMASFTLDLLDRNDDELNKRLVILEKYRDKISNRYIRPGCFGEDELEELMQLDDYLNYEYNDCYFTERFILEKLIYFITEINKS